jgi:hypothetical protein
MAHVEIGTVQAIEAFLSSMSLTKQEFVSRKALVDLVLAYHLIPGWSVS